MRPPAPRFAGRRHGPRSLALEVLAECRQGDAFAQDILDRGLESSGLAPADRRLATQLVYGVLRRRATLDALLRPVVARAPHQVEPWLRDVLRIGALQLVLLGQIPRHAAVHETVELAAAFGRPRAKGFVNGVLRALDGLVTNERAPGPSADAVPITDGEYRRLAKAVFPEPGEAGVEYVAAAFSLPEWLVERWLSRYPWEDCLRLGFWFAGPAPLWLRCNALRTDRAALLDAFQKAGVRAEPGEHPQAVRILEGPAVPDLPGYADGWFAVQDQSGMRVGSALAPAPGSRVLDLCAAPGGKTTHLAELMENQGAIVACDVDGLRLRTVTALAERLGVTIIRTQRLRPDGEPPAGPFDAVLVDVPCSNTGVLGRRPEVRWRLKPADVTRMVSLQTKLLLQAAEQLRPGGVLVYSTCSVEPEENGGVARTVAGAVPWLELEAEEEQMPGRPSDGGYWARLRRTAVAG